MFFPSLRGPGAFLATLIFVDSLFAAEPETRKPVVLTEAALAIHRSAFVVDGHNDLPWELRDRADMNFTKFDPTPTSRAYARAG
jgi:membrane dipeptidase